MRRSTFRTLEGWGRADRVGRAVDIGLIVLILLNVLAVTLESVVEIEAVMDPYFGALEAVSVLVFAVEYLLRVWASIEHPDADSNAPVLTRLKYMVSPMALVDLAAFLPSLLALVGLPPGADWRVLRVLRMIRILKLTRYSIAMQSIAAAIHNERRTMLAGLVLVAIALHLSAAAVYLAEREVQPELFGSIPQAMWWAVATLTTVGYGDAVPITMAGRIVGAVVMISGIGLFVLWTGLFASSFADELRRRDFRISWQMVSQAPLFHDLESVYIGDIARMLRPMVVPERQLILRPGEPIDSLFFIAAGEVEIEHSYGPERIGAGGYFGEAGVLHGTRALAAVVALRETRLMVLERDDLTHLMGRHPDIAKDISQSAEARRNAATKSQPARS